MSERTQRLSTESTTKLPKSEVIFESKVLAERKKSSREEVTVFVDKGASVELRARELDRVLGQKIRAFRKSNKISIDKFREGSHLSEKTLRDCELGKKTIVRETADRLHKYISGFFDKKNPLAQEILEELSLRAKRQKGELSNLGTQVLSFRQQKNISLRAFAQAAGISVAALGLIEKGGVKRPRKRVIDGIQKALKDFAIENDPLAEIILSEEQNKKEDLERKTQETEVLGDLFSLFRQQEEVSRGKIAQNSGLSVATIYRFEKNIGEKISEKVRRGIRQAIKDYDKGSAAQKILELFDINEAKKNEDDKWLLTIQKVGLSRAITLFIASRADLQFETRSKYLHEAFRGNPPPAEYLQKIKQTELSDDDKQILSLLQKESKINEALALLRDLSGDSQEQLANKSDIERANLSRIETGKFAPQPQTLVKLAKGLGFDVHHPITHALFDLLYPEDNQEKL